MLVCFTVYCARPRQRPVFVALNNRSHLFSWCTKRRATFGQQGGYPASSPTIGTCDRSSTESEGWQPPHRYTLPARLRRSRVNVSELAHLVNYISSLPLGRHTCGTAVSEVMRRNHSTADIGALKDAVLLPSSLGHAVNRILGYLAP